MTFYKIGKLFNDPVDCATLADLKEKAKELGDTFTIWYRPTGDDWWRLMLDRHPGVSFHFHSQVITCRVEETLDQALEKLK